MTPEASAAPEPECPLPWCRKPDGHGGLHGTLASAALKPCGSCGYHRDTPNHFYGCREGRYDAAKADPVASVIFAAMHAQDASLWVGESVDMGKLALDAAVKIREALGV